MVQRVPAMRRRTSRQERRQTDLHVTRSRLIEPDKNLAAMQGRGRNFQTQFQPLKLAPMRDDDSYIVTKYR